MPQFITSCRSSSCRNSVTEAYERRKKQVVYVHRGYSSSSSSSSPPAPPAPPPPPPPASSSSSSSSSWIDDTVFTIRRHSSHAGAFLQAEKNGQIPRDILLQQTVAVNVFLVPVSQSAGCFVEMQQLLGDNRNMLKETEPILLF